MQNFLFQTLKFSDVLSQTQSAIEWCNSQANVFSSKNNSYRQHPRLAGIFSSVPSMFSIGDNQLGVDRVVTFPEMDMGIHATESNDDKFEDNHSSSNVCL